MKLSAHHWHRRQLPQIALAVALGMAALLYAATNPGKLKTQLQKQQAALDQARQRYQAAANEKDLISKYLPAYQQLVQRGFIGEEQRQRWISDLRAINLRYKLFDIAYAVGAQQDSKPMPGLEPGNFKLHRSPMKLTFAMLHEYDLLTLLQALQANNPPFIVLDCVISRVPDGVASHKPGPALASLNAVCELDWLTVSQPVAEPVLPTHYSHSVLLSVILVTSGR